MTVSNPKAFYEIYIDESSQTKHRFLLLGGLIINGEDSDLLERKLLEARLPELPSGEMGWVKVSRAKLPAYTRVVDEFFRLQDTLQPLHFHSLAVDTHLLNDHKFNGGSRSVGFNKEIYLLCKKFGQIYTSRNFHVYPDFRSTDQKTEDLRTLLNIRFRNGGDIRQWPFRRIHFRDSSKIQIMQLVDLLLGGIAYRLNGHFDKPEASPAKIQLSNHILSRANIADVMRGTRREGKFTLWMRQLRK